jgi:hypothetical protein
MSESESNVSENDLPEVVKNAFKAAKKGSKFLIEYDTIEPSASFSLLDLTGLGLPAKTRYIFKNCLIGVPVDASGLEADQLIFEDCIFTVTMADSDSYNIEKVPTALNLDDARLRVLRISVGGVLVWEPKAPLICPYEFSIPMQISMRDTQVEKSATIEVKKLTYGDAGSTYIAQHKLRDEIAPLQPILIDAQNAVIHGNAKIDLTGLNRVAYKILPRGREYSVLNLKDSDPSVHAHIDLTGARFRQDLTINNSLVADISNENVNNDSSGLTLDFDATLAIVGGTLQFHNVTFVPTAKDETKGTTAFSLARARVDHLSFDQLALDAFSAGSKEADAALDMPRKDVGIYQCRLRHASDSPKDPDARSAERAVFWASLAKLSPRGQRQSLMRLARGLQDNGEVRVSDNLLIEEKRISLRDDKNRLFGAVQKRPSPYVIVMLVLGLVLGFVFVKLFTGGQFFGLELPSELLNNYARRNIIGAVALFVLSLILWAYRARNKLDNGVLGLVFDWVVMRTIKGGVMPLRVLGLLAGIWVAGVIMYEVLAHHGYMAPRKVEITAVAAKWTGIDMDYKQLQALKQLKDRGKDTEKSPYESTGMFTIAAAGIGPFDEESLGRFNGGWGAEHDNHLFSKIGVTDILAVCRKNWARPDLLTEERWKESLFKQIQKKHCVDQAGGVDEFCKDNTTSARDALWMTESGAFLHGEVRKSCGRFLPTEYSNFNSWLYSADIVIPLLDLRQEEEWSIRLPHAETGEPTLLSILSTSVEAIFTLMGWLIALILAGAVTGLSDPRRRPF